MDKRILKKWTRKHLLGIEELSKNEILTILNQAKKFKVVLNTPIPKTQDLLGLTVVNLFCEPSTRTRASFELAEKRLGADTLNISMETSSFVKGETLIDTARNLEAMRTEIIIMRHGCSGAPHLLAKHVNASIINAGDGFHEHPTQALLDAATIIDAKDNISGLNISIIGDISHSRVARSNIFLLKKLGANITICGPKTLVPTEIEKLGVKVTYDIKEALNNADIINVLRIQLERQAEAFFPSLKEYAQQYCITNDLLKKYAKKDVLIMHPGPINRGIELAHDVADGKKSLILQQVTNGVAVRMAVLYLVGQIHLDACCQV